MSEAHPFSRKELVSIKTAQRKRRRFLLTLLCDLLCTGTILCVFALFHHVIPITVSKREAAEELSAVTPTPQPTPAPTATPEPEPEEEIVIENKRQFPFEGVFSEALYTDESSYRSPNLSLTITTHDENLGKGPVRWYVCDIYVADIRNLTTALAHGAYHYYDDEDILDMMARENAVFAMSGDSCLRQYTTLAVRNGTVYASEPTASEVCALYRDGSMEILHTEALDVEALLARQGEEAVYQLWHFGPSLLDENGELRSSYNGNFDRYIFGGTLQPRTGIGYHEPGHYCFIVADGRGSSVGVTIEQFASLFVREGCALAYNLDGGRTSQIAFMGEKYNRQSNGNINPQNDIICLVDFDARKEG